MSPLESRNLTDLKRVRMFGPEKLTKNIADQKWSRVKIVCTQPFNKLMQFGLSFITVHAPYTAVSTVRLIKLRDGTCITSSFIPINIFVVIDML